MNLGGILLLFFGALLGTFSTSHSQSSPDEGRVVCYYALWSAQRAPEGRFFPHDINQFLCTHVIYSFAQVRSNTSDIVPLDPGRDIEQNGYKEFVDLKNYNDKLVLLIAVGGYREGSTHFTPISASPSKRQEFAQNVLKFLKKHGFEGINIDWQFPNEEARSGSKDDYTNFVLLLQEIDRLFLEESARTGNPKLLLTISVPGNTLVVEEGYNLPELNKYVEFMNILCYDYHFAFDPAVYHHSPLYPLPDEIEDEDHENKGFNSDATINYVISKGVPPSKLNIGIPLYGRTMTLEDPSENTIGSPATGQGAKGKATREDGFVAYYEICKNIKDGWTVKHPNVTAMGPYAYKGNQWVAYDDEESARRKGEYAKMKGLGGVSFWSIDEDDFKGSCGNRPFPLINAARMGYNRAKRAGQTDTMRRPKPTVTTSTSTTTPASRPKPIPSVQSIRRPTITGPPVVTPPPMSRSVSNQMTLSSSEQSESDESAGDGDSVSVNAAGPSTPPPVHITTHHPTPSGGILQNIYIWITNNIFYHSPPQFPPIDQQSLHKPAEVAHPHIPDIEPPGEYNGLQSRVSTTKRRHTNFYQGSPVWS